MLARRTPAHASRVVAVLLLAAPGIGEVAAQPSGTASEGLPATCAACHGVDGAGTDAGPRLDTRDLSFGEFREAVRQPVRTMPAFDLDEAAVARIYAYLESQPPLPRLTGRVADGAARFTESGCYSCHANEAQGGMHGPRLGPDPISWARFSWYVRHPSRNMPPYSTTVLTEQALADIYAFVESRPQPPALDRLPLLAP